MKIDDTDYKILSELQMDCRISIRQLSKKVSLSAPSVNERIKRLESCGIIEGYTIKINKEKIGFPLSCIIKVTIKNGEYSRFKKFIHNHPRSESCVRTAGGACFIVKLALTAVLEVEAFIDEISSFAVTVTMMVLSEVDVNDDILKFKPLL